MNKQDSTQNTSWTLIRGIREPSSTTKILYLNPSIWENTFSVLPSYKSVSQNAIQPIEIQNELKNNEDTFLSSSSLLSVTKTDFIPMNNSEFATFMENNNNKYVNMYFDDSNNIAFN